MDKARFWQKTGLVIFGLFLAFLILETGLRLAGFILVSFQDYANRISLAKKAAYKIACLGESTTQGQYPPYLEAALAQEKTGIKISVIDLGKVGTNTDAILFSLEKNLDLYKPDMVIVMMGANDMGGHMPYGAVSGPLKVNFGESLKCYKLARLAWMHVAARFKWQGAARSKAKGNGSARPQRVELDEYSKLIRSANGHRSRGQIHEAENIYQEAVRLRPGREEAYIGLATCYVDDNKGILAKEASKKAMELNPRNAQANSQWGRVIYTFEKNNMQGAEEAWKRAIELDPGFLGPYLYLARLYWQQKRLVESEEIYKQAIRVCDPSALPYMSLAILYGEMGKTALADEYRRKGEGLRSGYSSVTIDNYRKLHRILDLRGIRLVCVQYPMRALEPLKRILEGCRGIIFVDNEKVFKEAVNKEGYRAYFRDTFGGDFGHCTPKGNKLLAENIAQEIFK